MKHFQEIIQAIEDEIGTYYQAGAIQWIDKNISGAWSTAMDRFEKALIECSRTGDETRLEVEARLYKTSVLEFIKYYQECRNSEKACSFFEELKLMQARAG